MSVHPRRASRASNENPRATAGPLRAVFALLLAAGLMLAASGCGTNAQTLQPYTPGEGVNFDVGDQSTPTDVVHVRNLLIISKAPGSGIVSAGIVTGGQDRLVGVSGAALKADGTEGAGLSTTLPRPVPLIPKQLVVLTDVPEDLIIVKSDDLAAGLTATLTVQFEKAGEMTVIVPVVDGNEAQYATIGPSASAAPAE